MFDSLKKSLQKDHSLVSADYKLTDWFGFFCACFETKGIRLMELEHIPIPSTDPRKHRTWRRRFQANYNVMPEDFDLINIWPAIVAALEGKVVINASAEFVAMAKEVRRFRRMNEAYIIRHSCEGKGSDYAGYTDHLELDYQEIVKQKLLTMNLAEYLMAFLFSIKVRKFFMPSACNASVGFPTNLIQKGGQVQVPVITFNEGEFLKNLRGQVYSRSNVSILNPLRLLDPAKMSEKFLPSLTCELVLFDDKKPLPFKVIEVLAVKPK